MTDLLNVALQAMIMENLALVFLLGICTFIAVSRRVETAIGLGIAVVVVEVVTVPLNNVLYQLFLEEGAMAWAGLPDLDLSHLRFITAIGVIAASVQILELVLDRFFPRLHRSLGVYLPLLTVNCAVLGASLLMQERDYGFVQSAFYGFGAGLGWALAVILFAAIRERMRYSDAPRGLRDLGMAFIVTGFLAMAFTGLRGMEL